MPRVRLKTFGVLHRVTGSVEHLVEVEEGATVLDLLERFFDRYPQVKAEILREGVISGDYRVLLNGREVSFLPEGPRTRLKEGDEVAVIPPVGGGN